MQLLLLLLAMAEDLGTHIHSGGSDCHHGCLSNVHRCRSAG